jgi:hypothetical protein
LVKVHRTSSLVRCEGRQNCQIGALKFLIGQEKKCEPVVRSTMGLQPGRWNKDLGSNIQNVEALFIQMAGREASVRCDHCLAGRGIFALCVVVDGPGFPKCCGNCMYGGKGAKCTVLHHGQTQPVSVPNAGVYAGVANTGIQTSAASAARFRADITTSLESVIIQLQQLSTLQERQATAVADHQCAFESACPPSKLSSPASTKACLFATMTWSASETPSRRRPVPHRASSPQAKRSHFNKTGLRKMWRTSVPVTLKGRKCSIGALLISNDQFAQQKWNAFTILFHLCSIGSVEIMIPLPTITLEKKHTAPAIT